MQFYTFLETSLVTLSLLPHFIAFFGDGEIPGAPGTLATTFLAFGKFYLAWLFDLINGAVLKLLALFTVLNLAFALSVLGFLIMHISLVCANTTTIEVFLSLNFVYFFQMSICHTLAAFACLVDVV